MRIPHVLGFWVVAFLFVPCASAADASGLWTGIFIASESACGETVTHGGEVTMNLSQAGSTITGTLSNRAHLDAEQCGTAVLPAPESTSITGSVSGTAIHASNDDGNLTVDGSFSGDEMTLSFVILDGAAGTVLLSRSAQPADFSGTWSGPFEGFDAGANPPCRQSGPIVVSIDQSGGVVRGLVSTQGVTKCHPDEPAGDGFSFEALPSGSRFVALVSLDGGSGLISGFRRGNELTVVFVVEEPKGNLGVVTLTRSQATTPPLVTSFQATPAAIAPGAASQLAWVTKDASTVSISGVGVVPLSGNVSVRPASSTTYTLTAANAAGNATASAGVTVTSAPAEVVVSSRPEGMVQAAGGPAATDSFTLTNVGGTATNVTLTKNGAFFTHSPSSFALAGGARQTVRIVSTTLQAGNLSGSVSAAGTGVPQGLSVPIRLLVAPAAATAAPRPSRSRIAITSLPAATTPGSATFFNDGTSEVQALAVSDVPWIEPQTGVVTIPAGGSTAVSFNVLAAKRSDAGAPVGGATGSLSLRYLSGAAASASSFPAATTSIPASVSVGIVSVVPPVTAGDAPSSSSELVLFAFGLGAQAFASGDVLLSARGTMPELKLYLAPAGSVTFQSTSLASVVSPTALSFPAISSSVFGSTAAAATLQLRSAGIGEVVLAANRLNTFVGSGTWGTSLPVFRSDRGLGAGGRFLFPGVVKSTGSRTDLYVQETSGTGGKFRLDVIDAAGQPIPPQPSFTLRPYELFERVDVAVAGATALRVVNTSESSAQIVAYAVVVSPATGDAWPITDPAVALAVAPETWYIPVYRAEPDGKTTVYAASRGGSGTLVTFDVVSGRKRRAAASAKPPAAATEGLRVEPLETVRVDPFVTTALDVSALRSGFVRVRAPAGTVSLTARSVVTQAGSRAVPYGDSLPAVAAQEALTLGQSMRIAGIDDTGAMRSHLMVVETGGRALTLRVSLTYSFAAATKVTAFATTSHEFPLEAGGFLMVRDLVRAVLGSARDLYGDIYGIRAEIEVAAGEGSAIPALVTIDERTGDLMVRRR